MRPTMFMGGGPQAPSATFVGALVSGHTSSPPYASIPGIQVGDYVFIFAQGGAGDYGTLSGWNTDNYTWPEFAYRQTVFHKKITNLNPIVLGGGLVVTTMLMAAYRGASRATRKSIAYNKAASLIVPGFDRASDAVGVVSPIFDRNIDAPTTFGVPSPWVRRLIQTQGFFRVALADALPKTNYVDGANLTWSPFHTGGTSDGRQSLLYELRL